MGFEKLSPIKRSEEGVARSKEEGLKAEEEKQKVFEGALQARSTGTKRKQLFKNIWISVRTSIKASPFSLIYLALLRESLYRPNANAIRKAYSSGICFFKASGVGLTKSTTYFTPCLGHQSSFPLVARSRIWVGCCVIEISHQKTARGHTSNSHLDRQSVKIIAALSEIEGAREHFNLGREVAFENPPNILDEEFEEAQERLLAQDPDENAPKQAKADQIYVRDFEKGLLPMKLHQVAVKEYRIPKYDKGRKQYYAEKKVEMALVQTFNYMVESSLEYSYLSPGKALRLPFG
ncbi:hypothetical protein AJ78_08496 [Emergomyces pasteurianus Ep9510]|uniref:Uncharacterized protein n=1 Tax=Emergomyces pasteurianus Ep9510 TaxID=1447872 RepID=A0A1J9P133_9EURO|nr:hypothetical protein AJ78_08496 [Emergomyces pasteurianus Ep9510]